MFVKHISLTQVAQQSVTKFKTIGMSFVMAKAAAKLEPLFNKPPSSSSNNSYYFFTTISLVGFLNNKSLTQAAQQSVTKFTTTIVMNLVIPKAAAKLELLFNKPTSTPSNNLYHLFTMIS